MSLCFIYMYKVSYDSTYYTLCVYRYACIYACMAIRRLVSRSEVGQYEYARRLAQ